MNGLLSFLHPDAVSSPIFNTWVDAHLDVHADENFARAFTVLMVAVQLAAYRSIRDYVKSSQEKEQ
jgi:hypothetical protein